MMYMPIDYENEDEFNCEFISLAIGTIYDYSRKLNDNTITVYHNIICKYFDYFPEEVKITRELSEDEVKKSMLAWATNPERR